jgi:hypothetical protein
MVVDLHYMANKKFPRIIENATGYKRKESMKYSKNRDTYAITISKIRSNYY